MFSFFSHLTWQCKVSLVGISSVHGAKTEALFVFLFF